MAMPGMSQDTTGNPALTLVLALFLLGYILWAIDRLARLSRTPAPTPAAYAATAYPHTAGSPVLAPRLAASATIAMALTMGYMLITML
jgi:hypothetical protein